MDDNSIAALLEAEGERFRREHDSVTARPRRATVHRWLPALGVASLLAVIAVGVTLVASNPSRHASPPGGSPTASSGPTPLASARDVVLDMTDVTSSAVDADWVAVSGGDHIGQDAKQWIEVRRTGQLQTVVTRIDSVYAAGGPICLALEGDTLLWTDSESISSEYVPGPPTHWSLWQRDLAGGRSTQLASGLPRQGGDGEIPCVVTGAGRAAWSLNGVLTIRDLSTGTNQMIPDSGYPIASVTDGVVVAAGGVATLRPASDFTSRRVLANTPPGTKVDYWSAGPGHLLAFTHKANAETQDPTDVSACELPTCNGLRSLHTGQAMYGAVVTPRFAVWTDLTDGPTLVTFDGSAVPSLPSGYVPAHTLTAAGNQLLYPTQDPADAQGPVTLHLIDLRG